VDTDIVVVNTPFAGMVDDTDVAVIVDGIE
jgi:hypothetical protein